VIISELCVSLKDGWNSRPYLALGQAVHFRTSGGPNLRGRVFGITNEGHEGELRDSRVKTTSVYFCWLGVSLVFHPHSTRRTRWLVNSTWAQKRGRAL